MYHHSNQAKVKAKPKAKAAVLAKRARADDGEKRLKRELSFALGFQMGSDDEGDDENVVPENLKDEEEPQASTLSTGGTASQRQCPVAQRLCRGIASAWQCLSNFLG